MNFADKQELRDCIAADLFRYCARTDKRALRTTRRRSAGFRFTYYMRLCTYTRQRPLLKYTLFPIYKQRMRRAAGKVGIELHELTEVGKGLHIAHSGAIVVHNGAVLGENVCLSQGVTIGQTLKNGEVCLPVIGNRVYIAPGAKVIGGVHVGNNVAIGANAVVTHDVPDNAVVVGIPARVLHMGGAGEYVTNPWEAEETK